MFASFSFLKVALGHMQINTLENIQKSMAELPIISVLHLLLTRRPGTSDATPAILKLMLMELILLFPYKVYASITNPT